MKKAALVMTVLGFAASPVLAGDVLFDQIGDAGGEDLDGNSSASQYFNADFEAYNIGALDDFTLKSGVTLTSIEAVIGGWNGWIGIDGVTGWQVNIYSSPEMAALSLIGDVASADFDDANLSVIGAFDLAQLDVDIALDAGTYYLAVIPTNDFGANGQTGLANSFLGNGESWQANPNGGFGFPDGLQASAANFAYRIEGVIPAPGAFALLGLAGLVGTRRRRS